MRIAPVVILIFCFALSFGQDLSTKNKKAKKLYEQAEDAFSMREDHKAISLLEEVLQEDSCFFEAYLLAADIYHEIDSVFLEIKCMEKAAELNISRYPKLMYVLGNAYSRIGNYQKAKAAYEQYVTRNVETQPFYSKAVERIGQCSFALSQIENPVAFQAENLGGAINTNFDEYWPSLTVDGKTIIFTRLSQAPTKYQSHFNHLQEDFYWSGFAEGEWQLAQPLVEINTPYNEGAQSISADGKLIFFTACTQADGFGSCDIYYTQKIGGDWTKPRNVGSPVNSPAWESQPSISANGECLYFVSNRKGGRGGMDLWCCRLNTITKEGGLRWGEPQNLGDSINTVGNEMSPFIHSDGKTLYFASDKWPGMGGLDIFYAQQINDSIWHKAQNIGYPINTHKDEQGMIVAASGKKAFYSSDRPGSLGLDIYQFDLYPEAQPTPVSYIKGTVIDQDDFRPLSALVELNDVDENMTTARMKSSVEDGEFLMCLPLGKEYAFNVSKEGYLFFSENFALKEVRDEKDPFLMEIPLNRIKIGNKAILRNIFFKTDSYQLLEASKVELQLLTSFLRNNPEIKIEISGHTDNVGNETYNLNLSEKRAQAVYQYLADTGIDTDRLTYKGYGWSQPIESNENADGRSKNRRTEFRIIALY